MMAALFGWALEPADDLDLPDDHGHHPSNGHDGNGGAGEAVEPAEERELETVS